MLALPADDDERIDRLVELAQPRPVGRRFEQRSHALAAYMRQSNKAFGATRQVDALRSVVDATAALVQVLDRGCKDGLTMHSKRFTSADQSLIADMTISTACGATVRGSDGTRRHRQNVAAKIVATCALMVQKERINKQLRAPVADHSQTIKVYSLAFDSTKQRVKTNRRDLLPGEAQTASASMQKVFAQHGILSVLTWCLGQCATESDPFLVKAGILEGSSCDLQLDAILRDLPVDLENPVELRRVVTSCSSFWFVFCVDRDSSNHMCLAYIYDLLKDMPTNALAHAELCSMHGVQLVKKQECGRQGHGRGCLLVCKAVCAKNVHRQSQEQHHKNCHDKRQGQARGQADGERSHLQ